MFPSVYYAHAYHACFFSENDQIFSAYSYILALSRHWYARMENGEEASSSISPVGRGQLVKMLTTLESHGKRGTDPHELL